VKLQDPCRLSSRENGPPLSCLLVIAFAARLGFDAVLERSLSFFGKLIRALFDSATMTLAGCPSLARTLQKIHALLLRGSVERKEQFSEPLVWFELYTSNQPASADKSSAAVHPARTDAYFDALKYTPAPIARDPFNRRTPPAPTLIAGNLNAGIQAINDAVRPKLRVGSSAPADRGARSSCRHASPPG
jgi:hypothetical protein